MEEINYLLIAFAALVSIASPGPATLAIMGMSMKQGRKYGLVLALGILTGSLFWSTAAAFGLGAIMQSNAWVFEVLRYTGAMYLIYLSYRSLRSAMTPAKTVVTSTSAGSFVAAYSRGLLIHLTNPKAILFFAALYSLAVPMTAGVAGLVSVILFVGLISAVIFLGYAVLFATDSIRQWYVRARWAFETAFAALFGLAGFRLLISRFNN